MRYGDNDVLMPHYKRHDQTIITEILRNKSFWVETVSTEVRDYKYWIWKQF